MILLINAALLVFYTTCDDTTKDQNLFIDKDGFAKNSLTILAQSQYRTQSNFQSTKVIKIYTNNFSTQTKRLVASQFQINTNSAFSRKSFINHFSTSSKDTSSKSSLLKLYNSSKTYSKEVSTNYYNSVSIFKSSTADFMTSLITSSNDLNLINSSHIYPTKSISSKISVKTTTQASYESFSNTKSLPIALSSIAVDKFPTQTNSNEATQLLSRTQNAPLSMTKISTNHKSLHISPSQYVKTLNVYATHNNNLSSSNDIRMVSKSVSLFSLLNTYQLDVSVIKRQSYPKIYATSAFSKVIRQNNSIFSEQSLLLSAAKSCSASKTPLLYSINVEFSNDSNNCNSGIDLCSSGNSIDLNGTVLNFSTTLNQLSFVAYNLTDQNVDSRFEISFQFKREVNQSTGELLVHLQSNRTLFFLGIQDNHLKLQYAGKSLTSGEISHHRCWHSVKAGYSGTSAYIYLDSHPRVTTYFYRGQTWGESYAKLLYIGGVPCSFHPLKVVRENFPTGFTGSVYALAIRASGEPVILMKTNLMNKTGITIEDSAGVTSGMLNACSSTNPCNNNGTCLNKGVSNSVCECHPGFEGITCDDTTIPCKRLVTPCSPGGVCRHDGVQVTCDCPFRKEGTYCEKTSNISTPFFGRNSHMWIPTTLNVSLTTEISLTFKPASLNGVLLYIGGDVGDYFTLYLQDGYVVTRFNLGSDTATLQSLECVAIDHVCNVSVIRRGHEAVMMVNDGPYVGVRSSPDHPSLDPRTDTFFVGGLPHQSKNTMCFKNTDYVGAIVSLKVNEHSFLLNSSNTDIATVNVVNLARQCLRSNCKNGASCQPNGDNYTCMCPLAYEGVLCERELNTMGSAKFEGDGFWVTRFNELTTFSRYDFQLSFRTSEPEGLLIWYGDDVTGDLFSVGFKDGYLISSYMIDRQEVMTSSDHKFNDGLFHTLHITRQSHDMQLWVDVEKPSVLATPSIKLLMETDGTVFLGGLPGDIEQMTSYRYRHAFRGCIANCTLTETREQINFADKSNARGRNVQSCP